MAHSKYGQQSMEAKRLRILAGRYVRDLRLNKDLTQGALSKLLDLDYASFISAVENGQSRVPPDAMKNWAIALGVDRREFAKELLKFYDPYMHWECFGDHGINEEGPNIPGPEEDDK